MSFLTDLFGYGGYLDEVFSAYEPRKGQIELSVAIDVAIRSGRHLLGEGPCGCGKGLAYLAPAINYIQERQGRRLLVCTETHALQEQLIRTDLPILRKALPRPFLYTLLKGRHNYLCLRKYKDEPRPWLVAPEGVAEVEEWAATTQTGDRSELSFKPQGNLWEGYGSTSDECVGKRCNYYRICWANRARKEAADSDVVVTNFHMLMANIKYLGNVLPPFDVLVCDEAHKLADVARDCLGFSVSYFGIRRITRWMKRNKVAQQLADLLESTAREFFDKVGNYARSPRYLDVLREPNFVNAEYVLHYLKEALSKLREQARNSRLTASERGVADKMGDQCENLMSRLESGVLQFEDRNIYWLEEHQPRGWFSIESRPVEVGGILHNGLFDKVPSAILVSATMMTGGNFSFIRGEVGVPKSAIEVIGESAFDWENNARVIVPEGLPEPPTGQMTRQERAKLERDWSIAVADRLEETIMQAQGRTLGLFTSRRNMNFAADRLRQAKLPGTLLVQEEGATFSKLIEQFQAEPESTLLGVASCWTGIDVPGDTLSVVFIDKLPFPVPADPVVGAITQLYDLKYGPWGGFIRYSIPKAIMQMRQGVGRLLRCLTDRGVVVLADRRLRTKNYGDLFLGSLPQMPELASLDEISGFLFGEAEPEVLLGTNPYLILGVKPGATIVEIKKAFREQAKKYHPDHNGGSDALFKKVAEAYRTLGGEL